MTSKNAQLRALNERFDTGEGGVVSQMTMVLNGPRYLAHARAHARP